MGKLKSPTFRITADDLKVMWVLGLGMMLVWLFVAFRDGNVALQISGVILMVALLILPLTRRV